MIGEEIRANTGSEFRKLGNESLRYQIFGSIPTASRNLVETVALNDGWEWPRMNANHALSIRSTRGIGRRQLADDQERIVGNFAILRLPVGRVEIINRAAGVNRVEL